MEVVMLTLLYFVWVTWDFVNGVLELQAKWERARQTGLGVVECVSNGYMPLVPSTLTFPACAYSTWTKSVKHFRVIRVHAVIVVVIISPASAAHCIISSGKGPNFTALEFLPVTRGYLALRMLGNVDREALFQLD